MKTTTSAKAFTTALLLAAIGFVTAESCEENFCNDWWTIASGGEIQAQSDNGQETRRTP